MNGLRGRATHVAAWLAILPLLVTACSHAAPARPVVPSSTAGTATGSPPPAPASTVQCGVYDTDADTRALITGTDTSICSTLATSLSAGGSPWSLQPLTADATVRTICILNRGQSHAEVQDSGGAIVGTSLCSSLKSTGWSEDTAAEQTQSAEAQASASASASAAERAHPGSDVSTHLSALSQDAGSLSSGQLSSDLDSTDADLQRIQTDAKDGPGRQCVNVTSTIYQDAANGLYSDSVNTAAQDTASLQQAIDTVRAEIDAVQSDQQQLKAAGLPTTAGAAGAVQSANSLIATVIGHGNTILTLIDQDVDAGYDVANQMASGSCAGLGPGAPPAHLTRLK